MNPTYDFKGNVAVVTGAASGIGLAIAQAFDAAGARVAVGDINQDAAERAAANLNHGRAYGGAVDVRDEASIKSFFAGRAYLPLNKPPAAAGVA